MYPQAMLDLECFVLSGMTARDTLAAEMVFMFMERGQGLGRIDYPVCSCVIRAAIYALQQCNSCIHTCAAIQQCQWKHPQLDCIRND